MGNSYQQATTPGTMPVGKSRARKRPNGAPTHEREVLAYDIRRDAEYARRRLAEHDYSSDSPTLPALLAAARRFSLWCDAASDELVTNAAADVDQVREMWRREAVVSDIRFIPYGGFAALAGLGVGGLAVICALVAWFSGSASSWIYTAVLGMIAIGAFGYRQWTPSRLAVGPDADHSTVAALSAPELLNFGGTPQRRRYQPRRTRKQVR